jgi:hypothetical protein
MCCAHTVLRLPSAVFVMHARTHTPRIPRIRISLTMRTSLIILSDKPKKYIPAGDALSEAIKNEYNEGT